MRRRNFAALLLLCAASSALPGCIAVFSDDVVSDEQSALNPMLTNLEQRMDRIEQHLQK